MPRRISFIFLFALVIRIIAILALKHYQHPNLWENGGMAEEIRMGHGLAGGLSIVGEPTSWQAPGYPYLLAAFWNFLGRNSFSFLLLSLFQAVVISSVVFPIQKLTQRWFSPDASVFAAWIGALMPLYIWYPTRIHHTALVMAAHPWLLWLWLDLSDKKSLLRSWLAGFTTGVAGLLQPVLLGVYGILSAAFLLRSALSKKWISAFHIFFAGIITLLVITPWTIRNYRVHHRLILIKDSFGKEFWMGNNPHATGTGYAEGGTTEITAAYPPQCFALRGKVSEIELMSALQKEAWEYIKADPKAFVNRTFHKILWFWTVTPKKYERTIRGGEAITYGPIQVAYWAAFVILFGIGMGLSHHCSREYLSIFLLYAFIYSVIYGLTHVGQARFRGEIEFIFIPGCAHGIWVLLQFWKSKKMAPQA